MSILINLFHWLFSPRKSPIMRGPEAVDCWDKLRDMGYTVESYPADNGLRHYSFWQNGQLISDWSDAITLDDMYRMRRMWSVDELARVQESEE